MIQIVSRRGSQQQSTITTPVPDLGLPAGATQDEIVQAIASQLSKKTETVTPASGVENFGLIPTFDAAALAAKFTTTEQQTAVGAGDYVTADDSSARYRYADGATDPLDVANWRADAVEVGRGATLPANFNQYSTFVLDAGGTLPGGTYSQSMSAGQWVEGIEVSLPAATMVGQKETVGTQQFKAVANVGRFVWVKDLQVDPPPAYVSLPNGDATIGTFTADQYEPGSEGYDGTSGQVRTLTQQPANDPNNWIADSRSTRLYEDEAKRAAKDPFTPQDDELVGIVGTKILYRYDADTDTFLALNPDNPEFKITLLEHLGITNPSTEIIRLDDGNLVSLGDVVDPTSVVSVAGRPAAPVGSPGAAIDDNEATGASLQSASWQYFLQTLDSDLATAGNQPFRMHRVVVVATSTGTWSLNGWGTGSSGIFTFEKTAVDTAITSLSIGEGSGVRTTINEIYGYAREFPRQIDIAGTTPAQGQYVEFSPQLLGQLGLPVTQTIWEIIVNSGLEGWELRPVGAISYNDLTDLPTLPERLSDLAFDPADGYAGAATDANEYLNEIFTSGRTLHNFGATADTALTRVVGSYQGEIHIETPQGWTLDADLFQDGDYFHSVNTSGATTSSLLRPSNFAGAFLRDGTSADISASYNLGGEIDQRNIITITENGGQKFLNVYPFGSGDIDRAISDLLDGVATDGNTLAKLRALIQGNTDALNSIDRLDARAANEPPVAGRINIYDTAANVPDVADFPPVDVDQAIGILHRDTGKRLMWVPNKDGTAWELPPDDSATPTRFFTATNNQQLAEGDYFRIGDDTTVRTPIPPVEGMRLFAVPNNDPPNWSTLTNVVIDGGTATVGVGQENTLVTAGADMLTLGYDAANNNWRFYLGGEGGTAPEAPTPIVLTGNLNTSGATVVPYAGDPTESGFHAFAQGSSAWIKPGLPNQFGTAWSFGCEWQFSNNTFIFNSVGSNLRGRAYRIVIHS